MNWVLRDEFWFLKERGKDWESEKGIDRVGLLGWIGSCFLCLCL